MGYKLAAGWGHGGFETQHPLIRVRWASSLGYKCMLTGGLGPVGGAPVSNNTLGAFAIVKCERLAGRNCNCLREPCRGGTPVVPGSLERLISKTSCVFTPWIATATCIHSIRLA